MKIGICVFMIFFFKKTLIKKNFSFQVKGRRKNVPSFDGSADFRERALRNERSKRLPGDWDCPACSAHNFMRNIECFKCRCPRPLDTDVKAETPKYPTFVREPIDTSYEDLIPKEEQSFDLQMFA